jgi:hypothetical protein
MATVLLLKQMAKTAANEPERGAKLNELIENIDFHPKK